MKAETIKPAQADKPRRGIVNPQPLHVVEFDDALLTMRTLAALSGLSVSTLYRLEKTDPDFPKLTRIGKRCTRAGARQSKAWLAKLARA